MQRHSRRISLYISHRTAPKHSWSTSAGEVGKILPGIGEDRFHLRPPAVGRTYPTVSLYVVLNMRLLVGRTSGRDEKRAASMRGVTGGKMWAAFLLLFGKCDHLSVECTLHRIIFSLDEHLVLGGISTLPTLLNVIGVWFGIQRDKVPFFINIDSLASGRMRSIYAILHFSLFPSL